MTAQSTVSRSPEKMLPSSTLPSISEKIRAHRDREEHLNAADVREAEKSAKFGRSTGNRNRVDFGAMLLGPEFDKERYNCAEADDIEGNLESDKRSFGTSLNEFEGENARRGPDLEEEDWTVRPLPRSALSLLDSLTSIVISVPTARGGRHNVTLSARTIERIRGVSTTAEKIDGLPILSWLDDNVIDGFMSLINSRSELICKSKEQVHKPSKEKDLFNRARVRTFGFSSHFYTIWKRAQNGGYENVKRWRRKITRFNSIGMFMFPAFVNNNHWVLAVVDVDGQQFIYYDPQLRPDTWDVITCAKEWISGEVRTAADGDAFEGLEISSWPIVCNPLKIPVQTDSQSCGVFVLYVAEHLERGTVPLFTQSDIPIMRLRILFVLQQGTLQDCNNSTYDTEVKED